MKKLCEHCNNKECNSCNECVLLNGEKLLTVNECRKIVNKNEIDLLDICKRNKLKYYYMRKMLNNDVVMTYEYLYILTRELSPYCEVIET